MTDAPTEPWQQVAQKAQARRAAAIPAEWLLPKEILDSAPQDVTAVAQKFLSPWELELTALTASELAEKTISRQASAEEVATAFCHRAAIAHQLVNCLTEIFFVDGIEQAKALDRHYQETGKPVGRLHGVPVSIKDHFNVKGALTTSGYISYAKFPPKDEDGHIAEILRNAGAVLYCKTNNPQCMMVVETVSNIYGRTLNPRNTRITAGGSSGGEGALLAMRGSAMGVGSDVGGSIRIPAAFNGIYGFKPSIGRVPTGGSECTMSGNDSIAPVAGPICHSMEDLELFFQVISDAEPWLREPVLEVPWKTSGLGVDDKLRIGVMGWDEVVLPHPYITRCISEAVEKLKQAGHEVIEFRPYDHKRAWDDILLPLYFPDGGLDIKNTLAASGEPMFPSAKRLINDPLVRERSIHELWQLHCARDKYKSEYLAHWNSTAQKTASGKAIDVILCPSAPGQGAPHDVKPWWGYCAQWNLLDYPSGVIPFGTILGTDKYPDKYVPVNELDKENYGLYSENKGLYTGLPVSVQIVGKRLQDEKVMEAMRRIDKVLNGK